MEDPAQDQAEGLAEDAEEALANTRRFVRSCGGNELLQLKKMAPSEKPSWEAQTRSESTSCTCHTPHGRGI